jgi:hypothetical protein
MANPEYSDITSYVKAQVLKTFEVDIKFKILEVYRKYIYKLRNR